MFEELGRVVPYFEHRTPNAEQEPQMIRPITESDVEAYRAIRLRALTEEPESFGASPEDFLRTPLADVAMRLRLSDDAFVLGAWEPELVGTVGFVRQSGLKRRHQGMIWAMYVAPEARGRGLGRALMAEALARAAALPGIEQVHLGVVTTNSAARSLYLSLGFTIYGTERHALKLGDRYVDEELMVLEMTDAR
jgi:ribosomal protein S18 acetylase RimI-like enzyme